MGYRDVVGFAAHVCSHESGGHGTHEVFNAGVNFFHGMLLEGKFLKLTARDLWEKVQLFETALQNIDRIVSRHLNMLADGHL